MCGSKTAHSLLSIFFETDWAKAAILQIFDQFFINV